MIRRIELHNFASHEDTELDFGNGKNVMIGATGSGKTNILQAVDFAFLGDVPDVNLPELIADNSESAEVILDYDDLRTGQTYRIHRMLKRAADGKAEHECSITNLATNEVVRRPEPVRKTLESFGVDSSVWRYIVHVAQGKFGDLLEETQERRNSLDKLFEVSQLENAHQELGRREGPITQIEYRKQGKVEKKNRLDEMAKRLDQEQANLQQLEEQRKEKEQQWERAKKDHDRLKAISEKNAQTLDKLGLVEGRIRKAQVAAENAQGQITSLIEHLGGILPASRRERLKELPCAEIVEFLQELEQDLRKAAEEEQRRDKDHSDSMTKANEIKSKLDSANEQREALEKELDDVKEYLAGKAKQPRITCDRCGSILTKAQWKKHLKERQENVQELQKRADAYSEKLESAQAHVEECRKLWDQARTALTNLGSAMPIVKQIETQRRIIEQTHDPGLIKARSELLVQLRSLLALDSTRTDEEVVDAALSLPRDLNHLISKMQDLADDLESFDEEVLNPQIVRVNEAKTAQAQALQLESEIGLDEKRIFLLELIRKSLREVEPAVRRNFVTRITQSANDYLKRLYGGAELENFELTEDYQFLVTRAGYKRHARRLSGGQQVLASMAFLLALSEALSQLDFVILDEPTTHLDESRRKELVNVLENLKRVPQLIIVDHHPELLAAADTRFQVTLTREGQSQVALISE